MSSNLIRGVPVPVPLGQPELLADSSEIAGPLEHLDLPECEFQIRNVGWTLGNECPYRCRHCYSMSARQKGRNLEPWMIDRIVGQLAANGIETVNLGGNEPLFTNGINPSDTHLPYIVERLVGAGIAVGLTTAGVTLNYLNKHFPETVRRLNDVDVSLDSPFAEEHDANRGSPLYVQALRALEIAGQHGIPRSIILCGMSWNFTPRHLHALVDLARRYGVHVRINAIKPVEARHMDVVLSPAQYYRGFRLLMNACETIVLAEPPLASLTAESHSRGCPCGRSSFRIHSITPEGKVPVSPCVYLHDFKASDLLVDDLQAIVRSPTFRAFRRRNGDPQAIAGCADCRLLEVCRGGCAVRAYLTTLHCTQQRTLFARDPLCPRDSAEKEYPGSPSRPSQTRLVHQDYLCTWIGIPKEDGAT